MATAETANLLVKLTLGGNFQSQIGKATSSLKGLDKSASRSYRAGAQIGTGIKNSAFLAIGALTALTGVIALSVKEGADAAKTQEIYAQAIKNSGKVSADYIKILNDQQKALMALGGVDDELIKSSQTRLIQMGLTGKQVATLTPLILDFAKATGIDLLTATKLAGKAVQGNTGALSRYGVAVDKAKAKTDPFAATVDALNSKFGGTTQALSGDLPTRLAAFHEAIKNIREDAGQKLLPVLTKIIDVAGSKLVPAFGKFVDRILPSIISGLDEFSNLLANGGAEKGINAITDALGPLVKLVRLAAAPVKAIVGAFLSLPSQVQSVLIGAFAVNKLTGGLVTNVFGGIASAIAKSVISAPLVNVRGGVVNVGGGVPGGAAGGAASKGLSALSKVFLIGEAIGLVAAVHQVWQSVNDSSTQQSQDVANQTTKFIASQPSKAALENALAGVDQGIKDLTSNPLNVLVQGDALTNLQAMRKDLVVAIANSGGSQNVPGGPKFAPVKGGEGEALQKKLAAVATSIQTAAAQRDAETSSAISANAASIGGDIETMRGSIASGLAQSTATEAAASYAAGQSVSGQVVSSSAGISGTVAGGAARVANQTASSGGQIVGAIYANRPITNVDIKISGASVSHSVTVATRYGPTGGDRNTSSGGDKWNNQ